MGSDNECVPKNTRLKVTQPEKNKSLAANVKATEAKEDTINKKKNEALRNKENKEAKKDDKKEALNTQRLIRNIIVEVNKENNTGAEINKIKESIGTTVKLEIIEAMKHLGDIIVDTVGKSVKEAIKDKNTTHQENSQDYPLATQCLIDDIQQINARLNTTQPTGNTPPSDHPQTSRQSKLQISGSPSTLAPQSRDKILNIFPQITKEQLTITVNTLIDRVNELENTIKNTPKHPSKPTTPPQDPKLLPAIGIDLNGDPDPQPINRDDHQPLNYTPVKTAWKTLPPRPTIPSRMDKEVSKELKDFMKHQKNLNIKSNPQQEMETSDKENQSNAHKTITCDWCSSNHIQPS